MPPLLQLQKSLMYFIQLILIFSLEEKSTLKFPLYVKNGFSISNKFFDLLNLKTSSMINIYQRRYQLNKICLFKNNRLR